MWKDYEESDKIDENFREGSVKDHIISVLEQADNESPLIKLAALFHDVGKPATYKDREGKKTFYGHDVVGVKIFNDIADRMKISNNERAAINFAIGGHMKMHSFCEMRDSKCVSMMEDKNWEVLKAVSFADDKSRKFAFNETEHQQIVDKIQRLESVVKQNQITKQFLNGNLVMDYCGIKGKIVGDVLKKVREYVINNNVDVTTHEGKQQVYAKLDKHKVR